MDWNSDGKKDLLVGDANGVTHVFLNVGTDEAPVLTAGYPVVFNGTETFRSGRAAPFVVDWNEDEKKDLLVGQLNGTILLLINEGTDEEPEFPVLRYIMDGDSPLVVGIRSTPRMIDWNGNGKKDLICGELQGNIFFYSNTGTNEEPVFGPRSLIQAGDEVIDVGTCARIDIADWNDDGLPDLISGCNEGTVHVFIQKFIFKLESVSIVPGGTQIIWRSRPGDSYTVYFGDEPDNITSTAGPVQSGGYTTTWIDPDPGYFIRRFYRIGINGL